MGYIKKLKNNELVGGTDKTTVYPVTSAEAVFEEVSDNEFKSQKYLNNHITNERIVDNTIENRKLKDDTIDMGKLNTQLKTIIQNAYDASWKVKEEPFSLETKYDANDVVYDPDTNSSYVSLTADNQGNPVNPEDEGYVEGKWRIIINGISAVESTEVINAKVEELETEVDNKIDDAQGQLDQMIADAAASLADAESDARGAAAEASAVVANKVADAQIGYFECNTAANTALKQTTFDYIGTGNDKSYYTIPAAGSNVRIKMKYVNSATDTIELQFGSNTATRKQLIYNGEPASNSNSWDDGEVISVYYDPTYNNNTGAYQASNAQGGGGSKGMKELKGITGAYITNNGDTLGSVVSIGAEAPFYQYIKYPVNEGDVVMISGHGAAVARLWGIVGDNNVMIDKSVSGADGENLILIMPEGARFITLNSTIASNPKWYYARKDSAGAEEIFVKAYLYGGLRTLVTGQSYDVNEAVKTQDKQLLRVTKEVRLMNLTDEIAVGDLKAYDTTTTYKALIAIAAFDESREDYAEGDYAIKDGVVSKYDGSEWSAVTLSDYAADTTVWEEVDLYWLVSNITLQDSVQHTIDKELYDYREIGLGSYAITGTRCISYSTGRWDNNTQTGRWIYLIPIEKGQVYKITGGTNNSQYTFLHSYNPSKGGTVDYAYGYTNVTWVYNGDSVYVKVPDNAQYLYLLYSEGTNRTPSFVGVRYSRLDKVEEKTGWSVIPISSVISGTSPKGVAGNNYYTNWIPTNNYYGYWFDVTEYAGRYLHFKSRPLRYLFASDKPTNNSEATMAHLLLGNGIRYNEAEDVIIPSPVEDSGKVWFWVYTYGDGSTLYDYNDISIIYRADEVFGKIDTEMVYSQSKIINLARYINDNTKAFGLMHYSDLHGDHRARYSIIQKMEQYKPYIDEVIETGDRVYLTSDNDITSMPDNVLFTLGNHDGATGAGGHSDAKGKQWCFNTYFAPHLEAWGVGTESGVHFPTGYDVDGDPHQYAMYWYKDYSTQKIRLIGLDPMHFMGMDGYTDDTQEQWFQATLESTPSDYKVIVACHYGLDDFSGDYAKWDNESHKWKYNYIEEAVPETDGGRVMNGMTGKQTGFTHPSFSSWSWNKAYFTLRVRQEVTIGGTTYPVGTNRFGDILSSWIAGGGDFVAWICGHTHINLMYYPNRYPNILNVLVSSAGTRREGSPNLNYRYDGMNDNLCANIYYVNGDYFTIVRLGYTMTSKDLIPSSWVTINYKTGEITSEG